MHTCTQMHTHVHKSHPCTRTRHTQVRDRCAREAALIRQGPWYTHVCGAVHV